MKITVKVREAVWQITEFDIEVKDLDELRDICEKHDIPTLLGDAESEGRVVVEEDGLVDSVDSEYSYFGEDGEEIKLSSDED